MKYGNRLSQCKKKKYSKREGIEALHIAQKSHSNWRREKRVYFCDVCKAYHLTSLEEYEEDVGIEIEHVDRWREILNKAPP